VIRYAVVPRSGYRPDERVCAVRVHATIGKALEVAERLTVYGAADRAALERMLVATPDDDVIDRASLEARIARPYGFRVVATEGQTSWLGRELDAVPTATSPGAP
jgi:hypothetical protein